jgi:hypothetical protein
VRSGTHLGGERAHIRRDDEPRPGVVEPVEVGDLDAGEVGAIEAVRVDAGVRPAVAHTRRTLHVHARVGRQPVSVWGGGTLPRIRTQGVTP